VSAFLSAYGLFLAELLTLVVLVIAIVLLIAANRRGGHGSGLHIEHLNRHFEDTADAVKRAMAGKRGNGDICLNGPPAHHFQKGDLVIIIAEAYVEPKEMEQLNPKIVFVDEKNKITEVKEHKLIPHPRA